MKKKVIAVLLAVIVLKITFIVLFWQSIAALMGNCLIYERPFEKTDALLILSGEFPERLLEAVEIIREGKKEIGHIVVSRDLADKSIQMLENYNVPFETYFQLAVKVLVAAGYPADRIIVMSKFHASTNSEAVELREMIEKNTWKSVAVITSNFHTRRAYRILRKFLAGTNVEIFMASSRFRDFYPDKWTSERYQTKIMIYEMQKLLFSYIHI